MGFFYMDVSSPIWSLLVEKRGRGGGSPLATLPTEPRFVSFRCTYVPSLSINQNRYPDVWTTPTVLDSPGLLEFCTWVSGDQLLSGFVDCIHLGSGRISSHGSRIHSFLGVILQRSCYSFIVQFLLVRWYSLLVVFMVCCFCLC